jgi:predicted DsbA family dithiol-disulfide isomerase
VKRIVPFPLHPGLGREGRPLSELLRGYDLTAAHARLAQIAAAEGLPFHPPTHAWDTRLAQELAKWADERGVPLHDALFRAVFVEGKNVGDPDVLVALASGAGLPEEEARRVLEQRTHRAQVDEDWQFARKAGVTGVPTYAIGNQGVVGAQPYEVLEQLALQVGARRK